MNVRACVCARMCVCVCVCVRACVCVCVCVSVCCVSTPSCMCILCESRATSALHSPLSSVRSKGNRAGAGLSGHSSSSAASASWALLWRAFRSFNCVSANVATSCAYSFCEQETNMRAGMQQVGPPLKKGMCHVWPCSPFPLQSPWVSPSLPLYLSFTGIPLSLTILTTKLRCGRETGIGGFWPAGILRD